MNKLKLLFANGRTGHPFNIGGDGISIFTWFSQLAKEGHKCKAIGLLDPIHYPKKEKELVNKLKKLNIRFKWNYQHTKQLHYNVGYSSILVRRKNFPNELDRAISTFKPDVLLTQLELSPDVLETGQNKSLPVIFFIHDAEKENFLTINKIKPKKGKVYVIFNSHFTQSNYKNFLKVPQTVIYPPINPKDFLVSSTRRYITMINPVKEKGGHILEKIVAKIKDKQFLVVEGWYRPKKVNIYLEKYPHVVFWKKQDNMKKVYGQTKFLLAPSVWQEGFGRVVAEAAISGIPSIVSNVGGLPEAAGNGGIIIENYHSTRQWIKKIKLLDENKDYYQNLSSKAKKHAEKFKLKKNVAKFTDVLKNYGA